MAKTVEPDKFENRVVRLRRVGYVAIAKVNNIAPGPRYDCEVIKIESGETKVEPGFVLSVSSSEMKKIATIVTGSFQN